MEAAFFAETRGLSRSLRLRIGGAHLSWVGVRISPGYSSDARLFVPASAVTHISLPTSSNPLWFLKLKFIPNKSGINFICGDERIRTPDTFSGIPHFECGAFNQLCHVSLPFNYLANYLFLPAQDNPIYPQANCLRSNYLS